MDWWKKSGMAGLVIAFGFPQITSIKNMTNQLLNLLRPQTTYLRLIYSNDIAGCRLDKLSAAAALRRYPEEFRALYEQMGKVLEREKKEKTLQQRLPISEPPA